MVQSLQKKQDVARKPKHMTFNDPCDLMKRFYGTTTNNETRDKQTPLFVPWFAISNNSVKQVCEPNFYTFKRSIV